MYNFRKHNHETPKDKCSVPLVTAEGVTLKLLASLRCVGGVGEGCVISLLLDLSHPTPPLPVLTDPHVMADTQHSSQQHACETPKTFVTACNHHQQSKLETPYPIIGISK